MLISCRFYIVGVYLLLLTHIAHSFVLLTANVDDVKKIARKFVSDSLAEKIAEFIARATETMAQHSKISEENENTDQESSQVSAENRMYNGGRHGYESQTGDGKSKEEIVLAKVTVKVPKQNFVEKKRHGHEVTSTTRKHRKESKPLHGRSRYIVQTQNKASPAFEKAPPKTSEEEKYNKIQLIDDNLFSTPDGKTKNKKQKKKVKGRSYKLLSGFNTVESDPAKDENPDNRGESKIYEKMFNIRASDDEKGLSTATEVTEINDSATQTEKAESVVDQYDNTEDNNTETVATEEPVHLTDDAERDFNDNNIVQHTEKTSTRGSRLFDKEADVKEINWWEKELPAHDHEVNSKGKSWF